MTGESESGGIRAWWPWVVWLGVVHWMTAVRLPWENGAGLWWPTPDGLVLVGACLWLAARPIRRLRLAAHALAFVTWIVPLYRFGATFFPVFHGKPFEPYLDYVKIGHLEHLLVQRAFDGWPSALATAGLWGLRAALVAVVLAVQLGLARGYSFGLRGLCGCRRRWLRSARWLPAIALGLWAAGSVGVGIAPSMLRLALADLVVQVTGGPVRYGPDIAERIANAHARRGDGPSSLAGLAGADVHVLFVESYGRVAWGEPGRPVLQPVAAELDRALSAAGWSSATGYVYPSIHGGQSSLAHAEFQTGVRIGDRAAFDVVLESDLRALPRVFAQAGYRTFNVQPATTIDWPEGRYFGFQHDVFHSRLPYDGPSYHWGRMPDQFALRTVLERDVRPDPEPVYLQYVSVTSHAPYCLIPPYHADWSRAATGAAFDPPAKTYPINWLNYTSHPAVKSAYLDSLIYSLRVAVGYALELDRPALVLVLGDHQPPLPASVLGASAVRDVPLHVFTNRPELLPPFIEYGLRPGLEPAGDAVATSMAGIAPRLLEWFGR